MSKSIRIRLTITFLGLAVVPTLIVGLLLIFRTYTIQTQNAIELQREMAAHLSSRVQSLIRDLEKDLQMLIRIEDLLKQKKKRQVLLSIFYSQQSAIEDLILLDSHGRVLNYLSRLKLHGKLSTHMQKTIEASMVSMLRNITYFGPIHFQELSGEPLMIMAIPIITLNTGKLEGVLIADIRLKEIWDLVAKIRPGEKGTSYILDIKNRVIAHSNPSVVLKSTSFDPPDFDGVMIGLNGQKSVLASKKLNFGDQQFHIFVEDPVSESLTLAIQSVRIILTIIIIALIMASVLGFLTIRRIIRPIENIVETVRAINDGDLSRRVVVDRQDELGILASSFNNMTSQLKNLINDLEQRVAERTTELAASNKELEAFAYSVSHDLRAPLRHIDGFIDLLNKRIETILDEKGLHYMTSISDAAKKMGHLIDSLLSFSRMGRQTMSLKQSDLREITNDIINELISDFSDRKIHWDIADLPVVTGDPSMLRIVMMNLIANALKFTQTREQTQIEIGCQLNKKEAVIFVRDNGVGFDPAYIDKLFVVFQRLHRSDEFEGTGVGLAMVQRIIQRHGGKIWAEGEYDKGAVFYFSLPIQNGGEIE